ncbi:hypothetical protein SLA2020_426290 [Shorea laevis]
MEDFRAVLKDCCLNDLGYTRSKYTWCNCREDSSFTKERLDRAVANSAWCEKFQNVDLSILAPQNFDHCPLLLSVGGCGVGDTDRSDHFKFEAS